MSYRYGALTVLLGFEFNAANKLLRASDQGDIDTVRRVLERKPQLAVFAGFSTTYSPLHRAVVRSDEAMCREILRIVAAYPEKSCQDSLVQVVANQKSHKGLTPLMMACESGHRGIAEMLLDAGADPRLYDQYTCRTCLHYAAMAGKAHVVDFLTGDGVMVEHNGTCLPLRECVMDDIQVGSSKYIDQRSLGGLTALHLAAVAGSLDCSRILLQRGAAIMVKTDGDAFIGNEYLNPGSTPLHIAVLTNNIGIAHTIIAAHAAMMCEGPVGVPDAGQAGGDQQRRGRRAWEGSSRTDIRSVRNSHRKLPYHLARERRRRDLMHLVDPRINADFALDQARDAQLGLGAMRLSSICSHAVQNSLLSWLDKYEENAREPIIACPEREMSVVEATGETQDLLLPALPPILARKASLPPRYHVGVGVDNIAAVLGNDGQSLSPTFLDELSPVSLPGNDVASGVISGARHSHHRYLNIPGHGHHATADDFLLGRITTQLAEESATVLDGINTVDDDDDELRNNTIHHHDLLPVARPPLIRVHSENGLSLLCRRRFGSLNLSGTTPAGLSHPDTPDGFIKSASFDNNEEKDSDSTGSGGKGSVSGMSSEGTSVGGAECGVCLDATVDVEFKCGHQLCLDCSRSLTLQHKRAPLCPFCRKEVYEFRRASICRLADSPIRQKI